MSQSLQQYTLDFAEHTEEDSSGDNASFVSSRASPDGDVESEQAQEKLAIDRGHNAGSCGLPYMLASCFFAGQVRRRGARPDRTEIDGQRVKNPRIASGTTKRKIVDAKMWFSDSNIHGEAVWRCCTTIYNWSSNVHVACE
ncbi:hypothetical protein Trydic_g11349 [Trypoxylus dichotomus]